MGFSTRLDLARFISIGLNDVRVGDQLFGSVRIVDVLAELAKFKSSSSPYKRPSQDAARVNGKPADKITMDALYSRYAAFIRPGDNVVLESGSSSFGISPMPHADDVQVHIQMLWGSIGWATGATFGIALANRNRKTNLITGEGSHQLTANDIGNMGRFGANPMKGLPPGAVWQASQSAARVRYSPRVSKSAPARDAGTPVGSAPLKSARSTRLPWAKPVGRAQKRRSRLSRAAEARISLPSQI